MPRNLPARACRPCVALAVVLAVAAPLGAQTVVKNISSGVDAATGLKLPNNAQDVDYVVAPGGDGGYVGETLIARSTPLPSSYLPDDASAGSRWVAINTGQGLEGISVPVVGSFYFQTTVDLTGFDPSTASISGGRFAVDDGLTAILVNGETAYTPPVINPTDHFEEVPDGVGAGWFQAGLNTITFQLVNTASFTPVAFRFEGNVTATPIPEPGALAAAGVAVAGGLLARRRRGGTP